MTAKSPYADRNSPAPAGNQDSEAPDSHEIAANLKAFFEAATVAEGASSRPNLGVSLTGGSALGLF